MKYVALGDCGHLIEVDAKTEPYLPCDLFCEGCSATRRFRGVNIIPKHGQLVGWKPLS